MAGKVIAITGANGGLGRALAQRFAREGERVVLLGRTLSKVQEVASVIGEGALAIACDVGSPESVRAAFAEIAKIHPRLDVLINNAGLFQPFLIEEATDAQLVSGVHANLLGPMLCSRAAIPMMGRGGLIINVSSESIDVPLAHLLVYQSTKAGLERFSLGLQAELDDENKGIRTCIVRAGQMMGPGMSAEMEPVAAQRFHEACVKRGVKFAERGVTMYDSATQAFRNVIDAPPDMYFDKVSFPGCRTDTEPPFP
jgi:meso-butanediol dehydrogenase / (S,S)-butanediol dehydrogenase / diacetyl reductase